MIDHRLKEILADKRIRRFGVPDSEYQNYLNAEQFVLDMRGFTNKDGIELAETYIAMRDFGIVNPPFDRFVVHAICDVPPHDCVISSAYFSCKEDCVYFDELFEGKTQYESFILECSSSKLFTKSCRNHGGILYNKLIVMLSTRNAVKEHYNPPKAQRGNTSAARKRGSGGYTIVRPPRADEMPNYVAGGSHASPRPHLRRGHVRHFEDGSTTWVSPCFVNGEPIEARKAYIVRK